MSAGVNVGLMVGRLLVGLGIGISAVVVPTYTAEMAPPRSRGALVSVYEAMLCVGMVAAAIVNYCLEGLPGRTGYRPSTTDRTTSTL